MRPAAPALAARLADDTRLSIAVYCPDGRSQLQSHLGALASHADEFRSAGAEILLLDDTREQTGSQPIEPPANAAWVWRTVHTKGVGFVRAMNLVLREAAEKRRDALLLPIGATVFPGAITAMVDVAPLDPMAGFVAARSNCENGSDRFPSESAAEAAERHAALVAHLPEFTYAPTLLGPCVLIKHRIIAELGVLDEIYGDGSSALHDLTMRAGRCGYRVVLANRAFVFDEAWNLSPSDRSSVLLSQRYPEFPGLAGACGSSPERGAERLLETLQPDPEGRLDLAFDFSTFVPRHNGTHKAGRQLLEAAATAWRDRFRLHVLCSPETFEFHGYAGLGVEHRDPLGPERFAVIFRVGAPYNFATFERLARKGLVIGIYMLDTIPVDCTHYTSPTLFDVWQLTLAHIDQLATTSDLTARQLERRFALPASLVRTNAPHSLDLADYRRPLDAAPGKLVAGLSAGYLLIVGNSSWHKFVVPTANFLAAALPERQIVAFGAEDRGEAEADGSAGHYPPPRLEPRPNLLALPDGALTDADMAHLYDKAAAVIFPSHHEGFGFPLLEALAMRRPIFVRRLPAFEEVRAHLGNNPNIRFYDTTAELVPLLACPPAFVASAEPENPYRAADAAAEVRRGLEAALTQVRYDRLVARLRAVETVRFGTTPPGWRYEQAPQRLGRAVERVATALLSVPGVYRIARFCYRLVRPAVRP
jgi:hypothetical protein